MHSIHSPDYVFTVLVSIFISKIHNHPSSINIYTLLYRVRVMEFSASITCAYALWKLRTTCVHMHVRTMNRMYDKPTSPALCLSTLVLRQKTLKM